jgi:hypothetical protein
VLRRARIIALGVAVVAATAAVSSAGGPPRLAGSYPTLFRITAETNIVGVRTGQQAIKSWAFAPKCASGGCTTSLVRPSIAAGSTATYTYTLRPVSAMKYTGTTAPTPATCTFTNGKVVQGGYVNHQTMVLNVTKASGGKVVAYSGTTHTVNVLTPAGRASGCPATSIQSAVFHTSS